ncbi:LrgB family protein [Alteromonas sp. P256]|uniref:LrgB family protein n=1 Tax=Alteromonas sp. P256 TaxID=3117399 RepID=UPI002FDFF606
MIDAILNTFTVNGLIWLFVTLLCYALSVKVNLAFNGHPASHPLVMTVSLVGLALLLANMSVPQYQQSVSLLHWLLGPVTVALALPIFKQWQKLRYYGWRLFASIAVGGVLAPLLAWFTLYALGSPVALQLTMLAKSITTPLAMEATAQIGGIPALAAVFVITTGIVGAVVSNTVFLLCRVTSPEAQGIALGTVAHAVGTAKAIHIGEEVTAMATLGLCINGLFTAFVLPLMFNLVL